MKITQQRTLEKLRKLINEETKYRGKLDLVKFFNELGFNDEYSRDGDFPSRHIYTDSRLKEVNEAGDIQKCIKLLFNPINFIEDESALNEHVTTLNNYLRFDSITVIINNQEVEVYSSSQEIAPMSLLEKIHKGGSQTIHDEIKRIRDTFDAGDYSSTMHKTGNLLEATFKYYLDKKNISYSSKTTKISNLWDQCASDMKLKPKPYTEIDIRLRDIAQAFNTIISSLADMRVAGASHGKSAEEKSKGYKFEERHANLVVNASVTICFYLLDYLKKDDVK